MLRLRPDPPLLGLQPIPDDPDGRCELDALRVGGDYTPGIVEIRRAGIPYTWDKRKGYGYAGAWLVFTGDDLAEFETEFRVWRDDQLVDWRGWARKYLTKPPAQPQQNGAFLPNMPRPKALGVYHPLLAELGITQIVPRKIGQWMPGKGASRGKYTKIIEWIQFRPPVPLLGRPNGAIPDAKAKGPTASDAVELQIRSVQQDIAAARKDLARGRATP